MIAQTRLPIAAAATVLLFLFAIHLLGAATEAASPLLRRFLFRIILGDSSALGFGWAGAYVLANGSVVAALAISLFVADLLTVSQLFLMIVGSRLGGAAIVVFIGAADHLQRRRHALADSMSMGMLTFLLTLSVYLPVAGLGYIGVRWFSGGLEATSQHWVIGLRPFGLLDPLTGAVTTALGPGPAFLLAFVLLFGSLKLFDRVLSEVDTQTIRRRFFRRFERLWVAFGLGLLVTTATTSVAFSLGVIVPLYNRGYVKRDELIPYVLGANIGTLFDTLVVAVVLGTPTGTAVVLLIMALALGVTLIALIRPDHFGRTIGKMDDRLRYDRAVFVGFAALLVLVPVALLLGPVLLR